MPRSRMLILIIGLLVGLLIVPMAAAQDNFQPNAQIIAMSNALRLREAPNVKAEVVAELAGGTPLRVLARTKWNSWLYVQTADGLTGWVSANYVDVIIDLANVQVLDPSADTPALPTTAPTEQQTPQGTHASVRPNALNLRAEPSTNAEIITELPSGLGLTVTGRTAAGEWLQVITPDNQSGWVASAYLNLNIKLSDVEVIAGVEAGPIGDSAVTVSLTGMQAVYQRGKEKGNNPNLFSKVGDSITVSQEMYDPIGRGVYNLGEFGHLQAAIDHFWLGENSFTRESLAAGSGWTTSAVLNPKFSKPSLCHATESPLECEYRVARPAVALIMFGTNDVAFIPSDVYAYNLNRIVEISMENGVIPVLSTIPVRRGFEGQVDQYNAIIREIAASRGVPLWDYYAATIGLPNSGLSGDGVHPSSPPAGYQGAADFTGENLQYGYTVRNLGALQTLYALLRDVL